MSGIKELALQPAEAVTFFLPDEVVAAMDRGVPGALRMIADAIECGRFEAIGPRVEAVGGPRHDPRAHLLVRFVIAAKVVQVSGAEV